MYVRVKFLGLYPILLSGVKTMGLDLSQFQGELNGMAIKLAVLIIVPTVFALIVKFILVSIKIPNYFAYIISIAVFGVCFYKLVLMLL